MIAAPCKEKCSSCIMRRASSMESERKMYSLDPSRAAHIVLATLIAAPGACRSDFRVARVRQRFTGKKGQLAVSYSCSKFTALGGVSKQKPSLHWTDEDMERTRDEQDHRPRKEGYVLKG